MIESINTSCFAEIVLIAKKGSLHSEKSLVGRIKNSYRFILYKLYRKVDDDIFKITPDAFESKDLRPLIKNSDILEVLSNEKKFSDSISAIDGAITRKKFPWNY